MLVLRIVTFGFISRKVDADLVRLGSSYGGWWVPNFVLENRSMNRVLISAGLGFDVTFDEALLAAGFEVIGMDPLEESVFFANQQLGKFIKFTAINKGLWAATGFEKFYPPKNSFHDSWSTTNIQNAPKNMYEEFPVMSIEDLTVEYPQIIEADFVILKMDIEGSEIEVLQDLKVISHAVHYLAVEFDFLSLIPFRSLKIRIKSITKARQILSKIQAEGFRLIKIENFNMFWIAQGLKA
jgi:FkbM family methyltransferase